MKDALEIVAELKAEVKRLRELLEKVAEALNVDDKNSEDDAEDELWNDYLTELNERSRKHFAELDELMNGEEEDA